MKKIILCCIILAAGCGDDLGWGKLNISDADCYDIMEVQDSGACEQCQDVTEINDAGNVQEISDDATIVDSSGDSDDGWGSDASSSWDTSDISDIENDITETTDSEENDADMGIDFFTEETSEEAVVLPECVTPADCKDDSNPCTDSICENGKCVIPFNIADCDDGDSCTLGDKCSEGKCVSGSELDCPGTNCIISSCENGKCKEDKEILNDVLCNDNDVCTVLSKCLDGKCLAVESANCDDGNFCTEDSCDKIGGCKHDNNLNMCSDNNMCSENDICEFGLCVSGASKNCDDSNACTLDSCDPVIGCSNVNQPDGVPCASGICNSGLCSCPSGFGCAAPSYGYVNDSDAGMLGGLGGGVGPKMGCDPTDVLIGLGFDFSTGTKTATRTTIVCGKVTIDNGGIVSTTKTTVQKSGGSGCYGWDPSVETPLVQCDSGWAITGIKGKNPGSTLFNSVKIVCGQLGVDGKPNGAVDEITVPGMPGSGVDQSVSCSPDSIARFFETRSGCGQDALTMYCATPVADCTGQLLICKDIK